MFREEPGDIFRQNAQAIVNPVNCVGVMGAGLALQFKNRFRDIFKDYKALCDDSIIRPGKTYWAATLRSNPTWVVHFPTKGHWKQKSLLKHIKTGLAHLASKIIGYEIESIAIPRLGCGLGGLSWEDVLPEIKSALKEASEHCDIIIVSPPERKPQ